MLSHGIFTVFQCGTTVFHGLQRIFFSKSKKDHLKSIKDCRSAFEHIKDSITQHNANGRTQGLELLPRNPKSYREDVLPLIIPNKTSVAKPNSAFPCVLECFCFPDTMFLSIFFSFIFFYSDFQKSDSFSKHFFITATT